MKNFLLPDCTVKNVALLDEAFYTQRGIKALIFDIDNTLVRHTEEKPPQNVLDYFALLREWNIRYSIVSNNNPERVGGFCKDLGVPYYASALKPRKKYIKRAMRDMGAKRSETALVGDQLFTDMLGGNLFGIFTVLVTAVGEDETSFVSFKRKFEKILLEKNKHKLFEYKK